MMLIRQTSPSGVVFYSSPLLTRAGVGHGFSTRIGGVSPAPFDSLNLGNPSGVDLQDDRGRIGQNYDRLMNAVGCGCRTHFFVHQVHGSDVAVVTTADFSTDQKADGIVTSLPGTAVSVRIADCCPVLLASGDCRTVAAIHAGWRGAVGRVIPGAIAAMGVDPSGVIAAIGPCIGFDAFEVGPEVLAEFDRTFGSESPVRRRADGKGHADIAAACRLQLLRAGVGEDRIDTTDRCTFRDTQEFFSHRRDRGVTGRMAAVIATNKS